jgi:hypothetical protein
VRDDFDPDFQAELDRENPHVFWGAEIPTGGETIRLIDDFESVEFDGNDYHPALLGVTPMVKAARQSERALDVQQIDVAVSNLPGMIPPGTRLHARAPKTLEANAANVHLYAYTEHDPDGSPVLASLKRELLYTGVPRLHEEGWTYTKATVRLQPLLEKYLNAPICETIDRDEYGFARESDVGKAIPKVIGGVKGALGRVTKASFASLPVAASANTGSASLGRPTVNAGASDQTYTVTVANPETVEFAGPGDTDHRIASRWTGGGGTDGVAYAQSFQLAATRSLAAVTVPLKRVFSVGGLPIQAQIRTNSGSAPSTTVVASVSKILSPSSSSYEDVTFSFVSPVPLAGSTTYWIVIWIPTLVGGAGAFTADWRAASGGGYSGGNAKRGTVNWTTLAITWGTSVDSRDHIFALLFADENASFSIVGSVAGAQGSGTTGMDFTTTDEHVTIPGSAWSGEPVGGDVFTFEIDLAANEVVFADSPASTPCMDLGNFRWNGDAIGGTTVSQTSDSTSTGATVDDDEARGQSFAVTANTLVAAFSCKVLKASSPTEPLVMEIQTRALPSGLPSGNVLASVSFAASEISTTAAVETKALAAPIILEPGNYWIVWRSNEASGSYAIRYATTDPYAGGRGANYTSGAWAFGTSTTDFYFEVVAATVTLDATGTDYASRAVAKAELDVDIPDGVTITADVVGYQDDSSGTYTGAADQLITIPADVIHFLARQAGLPAANIDLAEGKSFSQSRAFAGSVQRCNGVFDTPGQTYKHGMLGVSFENRSLLGWSVDKLTYRYQQADPEISAIISWDDVVDDAVPPQPPNPQIRGFRTKLEDWLINRIELRYDRDWTQGKGSSAYRRTYTDDDPTSIANYEATYQKDEAFMCDFITTEAHAADTTGFYLTLRSEQKDLYEITLDLSWARLEEGDVLALQLFEDVQGIPYFASPAEKWIIEETRPDPEQRRFVAVMREV